MWNCALCPLNERSDAHAYWLMLFLSLGFLNCLEPQNFISDSIGWLFPLPVYFASELLQQFIDLCLLPDGVYFKDPLDFLSAAGLWKLHLLQGVFFVHLKSIIVARKCTFHQFIKKSTWWPVFSFCVWKGLGLEEGVRKKGQLGRCIWCNRGGEPLSCLAFVFALFWRVVKPTAQFVFN